MATEALSHQAEHGTATPTRRGGLVDRLLVSVDRLPGPASLSWLAIGTTLALLAHALIWSTGVRVGEIIYEVAVPAFMFAWFAWLLHALNFVARRSFDDFRPALGDPSSEERYLAELTTVRNRDAVIGGLVVLGSVSGFFYLAVRPFQPDIAFEVERVSAPLWGLAAFALGVVVAHTIRQLRLVSRLSAVARNVDIFDPASINAFSRLTAVSALGLIAFVVAYMVYSRDQPLGYIVQEVALLAVAAASFVLPLRVMHDRLIAEKKRLMSESQERLKLVLARIHEAVDSNDDSSAEQLNHMLTNVLAERELLNRLHTWPWSTATIRGFTSALLLPIVLVVLTQVIDRFL